MDNRKKTQGIIHIVSGVVVLLIGVICFAGYIYKSVSEISDSLVRFKAPGSIELRLDQPGRYGIFVEYKSNLDGKTYNATSGYEDISLQVTHKDSGKKVPITVAKTNETYDMGGNAGYLKWNFDANVPGVYVLDAQYPDMQGPEVVFAVGSNFFGRVMKTVILGVLFLFAVIIVSGIFIGVGTVKIVRAKRGLY